MDREYNFYEIERKWNPLFVKKYQNINSDKTKPKFSMIMSPFSDIDDLHMNDAFTNIIQDVIKRYLELKGFDTCWIPGIDCADATTQASVERCLLDKGINKENIGKYQFINETYKWKDEREKIIIDQLKKIGCSCNWNHEYFIFDEKFSELVQNCFIKLFNDDLIYRNNNIINWSIGCQSVIESYGIINEEIDGKLYYLKYKIKGSSDFIIVATTRPETIFGDVAIAMNPKDIRYKHLVGHKIIVPIIEREIPLIEDEYSNMDFGTGLVKITPAHDINEHDVGKRHGLKEISVIQMNGKIYNTGTEFDDLDRFVVRDLVINKLKDIGSFDHVEDHKMIIKKCSQTNTIIEQMVSIQWFVKMDSLAKLAIDYIVNNHIKIFPEKEEKIFISKLENIQDWCISRQYWWGQKIPVWYKDDEIKVQIMSPGEDWIQDDDVLDTWFSSWLCSLGCFDNDELASKYNPINLLITGKDNMFHWGAKMIMASIYFKKEIPFNTIYLHEYIGDDKGIKMSKSLGNVINPRDIIKDYGVDALRFSLLYASSKEDNCKISLKSFEIGETLRSKLWNTTRVIFDKIEDKGIAFDFDEWKMKPKNIIESWALNEHKKALEMIEKYFGENDFLNYSSTIDSYFWNFVCLQYIEVTKHLDDDNNHKTLYFIINEIIGMLYPLMPFITSELNSLTSEKLGYGRLKDYPLFTYDDEQILSLIIDIVKEIRIIYNKMELGKRKDKDIKYGNFYLSNCVLDDTSLVLIKELTNINELNLVNDLPINVTIFGFNKFTIGLNHDDESVKKKLKNDYTLTLNRLKNNLRKQNVMMHNNNPSKNFSKRAQKRYNNAKEKHLLILNEIKQVEEMIEILS